MEYVVAYCLPECLENFLNALDTLFLRNRDDSYGIVAIVGNGGATLQVVLRCRFCDIRREDILKISVKPDY